MHRFLTFLRSSLAMLCLVVGAFSITFAAESVNLGEIIRTPDRVAPGELRQGGVFEASVGFNIPDPNVAIEPPSIEAPSFVRIVRQKVEVADERTRITLRLSFDTSRTGHFQGNIQFRGGLYASDIAVDFKVVTPQPGQPRVLILDTPWTHYGVEDASMLQPWVDIVRASGVIADYRWLREADHHYEPMPDLSGYHAVLLSGDGLLAFGSQGGRSPEVRLRRRPAPRLRQPLLCRVGSGGESGSRAGGNALRRPGGKAPGSDQRSARRGLYVPHRFHQPDETSADGRRDKPARLPGFADPAAVDERPTAGTPARPHQHVPRRGRADWQGRRGRRRPDDLVGVADRTRCPGNRYRALPLEPAA